MPASLGSSAASSMDGFIGCRGTLAAAFKAIKKDQNKERFIAIVLKLVNEVLHCEIYVSLVQVTYILFRTKPLFFFFSFCPLLFLLFL